MGPAETWALKEREKKRLNEMEIKCLRSMCAVTRMDSIRNLEIKRRVGVQNKLSERVEYCAEVVWTCKKNG